MLSRTVLGDLQREMESTRRALSRVPGDRLDFRPHERSWTLGELSAHLANLVAWQLSMLRDDAYDLAAPLPDDRGRPGDVDEILERFDRDVETLLEEVAAADDETLRRPWTLRNGEEEVFTLPRIAVLRSAGLNHMIHHRGQLTVYLRLVGAPVPGLYGPSADEGMEG